MKRRNFLALGLSFFPYVTLAATVDYRRVKPAAWKASSLNEAAMALYGREKFSTIQKSSEIELVVPKASIKNREEIPVRIRTDLKAKTLALFQDSNPKSLVAVFEIQENSVIEYELNIAMAFKGTLFAVVEGLDGRLYYARAYVDILTLSCMA